MPRVSLQVDGKTFLTRILPGETTVGDLKRRLVESGVVRGVDGGAHGFKIVAPDGSKLRSKATLDESQVGEDGEVLLHVELVKRDGDKQGQGQGEGEEEQVTSTTATTGPPSSRCRSPSPSSCLYCSPSSPECSSCGCVLCRRKDSPETALVCDNCDYFYHLGCLDPPVEKVPDGDWYCKDCLEQFSKMATPAASPAVSTPKKVRHGPFPGVEVGAAWATRQEVCTTGLHSAVVSPIAAGGASVILSRRCDGREDRGEEFVMSGVGGGRKWGPSAGNVGDGDQPPADQKLRGANLALARACAAPLNRQVGALTGDNWRCGLPVRVVRSARAKSPFAPAVGFRYDGIYKVVSYWWERMPVRIWGGGGGGRGEAVVWRFRLRRDDPTPVPWAEGGEKKAKKRRKRTGKRGEVKSDEKAEVKVTPREEIKVEVAPPGTKKTKVEAAAGQKGYKIKSYVRRMCLEDGINRVLWEELLAGGYSGKEEFRNAVSGCFACPACGGLQRRPVRLRCACARGCCAACAPSLVLASGRCAECGEQAGGGGAAVGGGKTAYYRKNPQLRLVLRVLFPGYDEEEGEEEAA